MSTPTSTWTRLLSPADFKRSASSRGRRSAAFLLPEQTGANPRVTKTIRSLSRNCTLALMLLPAAVTHAQTKPAAAATPFNGTARPLSLGVLAQGGFGVTEDRGNYKFFMLGGRAGKVLTPNIGPGLLHGNFEYG